MPERPAGTSQPSNSQKGTWVLSRRRRSDAAREVFRNSPRDTRVCNVSNRLDISAPCDTHDLGCVVDHGVPSAIAEMFQPPRHSRSGEIMEQNKRIFGAVRLAGHSIEIGA